MVIIMVPYKGSSPICFNRRNIFPLQIKAEAPSIEGEHRAAFWHRYVSHYTMKTFPAHYQPLFTSKFTIHHVALSSVNKILGLSIMSTAFCPHIHQVEWFRFKGIA